MRHLQPWSPVHAQSSDWQDCRRQKPLADAPLEFERLAELATSQTWWRDRDLEP
jgi:hypothetical protein